MAVLNLDVFNNLINVKFGNVNPIPKVGMVVFYQNELFQIVNCNNVCCCGNFHLKYFDSFKKESSIRPYNSTFKSWLIDCVIICDFSLEKKKIGECNHEFILLFTSVCCKHCGVKK